MNSCSCDVRNIHLHGAEVMSNSRRATADVTDGEILVDADIREQLHLVTRRERRQIVLESRQINHGVRGNILGSSRRENRLPLNVVGSWQSLWNKRVVKWN